MKILVNYATVSGNSSMLTEQLVSQLTSAHPDIEFVHKDADECKGEDYSQYDLIIFASSTWDDGNMNIVAEEYINQLDGVSGKQFALIGLGDSSYQHFNTGVDLVATKLSELGAKVVGEIHKIDGFIEDSIVEAAKVWAEGVIGSLGQSQSQATPQAQQGGQVAAPAQPAPQTQTPEPQAAPSPQQPTQPAAQPQAVTQPQSAPPTLQPLVQPNTTPLQEENQQA